MFQRVRSPRLTLDDGKDRFGSSIDGTLLDPEFYALRSIHIGSTPFSNSTTFQEGEYSLHVADK